MLSWKEAWNKKCRPNIDTDGRSEQRSCCRQNVPNNPAITTVVNVVVKIQIDFEIKPPKTCLVLDEIQEKMEYKHVPHQ